LTILLEDALRAARPTVKSPTPVPQVGKLQSNLHRHFLNEMVLMDYVIPDSNLFFFFFAKDAISMPWRFSLGTNIPNTCFYLFWLLMWRLESFLIMFLYNRYCMKIWVMDHTDYATFVIFDKDASSLFDMSCAEMLEATQRVICNYKYISFL
jgi:hypothetical protein